MARWLKIGNKVFDFGRVVSLDYDASEAKPDGTPATGDRMAWVMIDGDVERIEFHNEAADAFRSYLDDTADLPEPISIVGIGEVQEIIIPAAPPSPDIDRT